MRNSNQSMNYQFTQIANFDARHGYKKCIPRGATVSFPGEPAATTNFWRNKSGNLVVRFSSQGYRFSFEVVHSSGATLLDSELDEFSDHVCDLLHTWLVEGVDDTPSV